MSSKKLISLGKVSKPHGIKGEAELYLFNSDYEESILEEGMKVLLFPLAVSSEISHIGEEWEIEKLRFGNKAICLFKGIQDRTQLEKMLPFEIKVPREIFPEPEEGEVYLVDLLEWDVVDPTGKKLGQLESFSDNGQQYILEVRLLSGGLVALPYVELFFPKIDHELRQITLVMPEFTE